VKTAFSLRYQDIKIGTGADAEAGKITRFITQGGWGSTGARDDGRKFDSSYDHPGQPVMDKDGKMERDADGQSGAERCAADYVYPGMGRAIRFRPGVCGDEDWGEEADLHSVATGVWGEWASGAGCGSPGIPAKSDLIFDVELLDRRRWRCRRIIRR